MRAPPLATATCWRRAAAPMASQSGRRVRRITWPPGYRRYTPQRCQGGSAPPRCKGSGPAPGLCVGAGCAHRVGQPRPNQEDRLRSAAAGSHDIPQGYLWLIGCWGAGQCHGMQGRTRRTTNTAVWTRTAERECRRQEEREPANAKSRTSQSWPQGQGRVGVVGRLPAGETRDGRRDRCLTWLTASLALPRLGAG